jgi:hypothetical protein
MPEAAHAGAARRLEDIPDIGPALARDLRSLGIDAPARLERRNAFKLYQDLSIVTARRHDPCVPDTFMATVDFINGNPSAPWWHFTQKRKQLHPNL